MTQAEPPTPVSQSMFVPSQRGLRLLILGVMFVAALAIRLYHIDQPPVDFHPLRQFRAALIARAYYFDGNPAIPQWRQEVALAARAGEGLLEPQVVEVVASWAYRLAGGEHLWIPRLLSALYWVTGGVFLYLLAKEMLSPDAAVFSTAFYLFLPFAVTASRSFQPDPLMIMTLLAALWLIWRYDSQPTLPRLLSAGVVSAIPLFVKPISLMMVVGAFIALRIFRHGLRRGVFSRDAVIFAALSLTPMLVYNLSAFLWGGIGAEAQAQFLPGLLLTRLFWAGWFTQIARVIGPVPFVGALLGLLMITDRRARAVLFGLWLGYVAFGLIFTYTIHSHDYYQLQLVPVVALCLGPIGALIMERLGQVSAWPVWRAVVLSLMLVLAAASSLHENRWRSLLGFYEHADPAVVQIGPEIGELVGHSTHTIFLSEAYGRPLAYYGELYGVDWPTLLELQGRRLQGVPDMSLEERFAFLSEHVSAEYFIITDLRELERQPELERFLSERYPIMAEGDGYLIFDLRDVE